MVWISSLGLSGIETNRIYCTDVRQGLKWLPSESIDCVVTSPPYWALRDYVSKPQIWDGDSSCEHKWEENERRLHGGTTKSKVGTVFSGAAKTNWVVKDNFCKKCDAWKGELGLEPTFDLYIKHLCDIFDEVKRVLKKTGTCWVNLGDTYSAGGTHNGDNNLGKDEGTRRQHGNEWIVKTGLPQKSLCQIPSRFAIEMSGRGWILRNEIVWYKPNSMPASVKDRFTVDFEKIFFFTRRKKYHFTQQFESIDPDTPRRARNSFNKAREIRDHPSGHGHRWKNDQIYYPQGRNKRCVWKIPIQPFPDGHFAVFPESLVRSPIEAGCPKGGIVLDPFAGSGTTAVVAKKLGRQFVGFDVCQKYVDMAEKRLSSIPLRLDEFVENKEVRA